MDTLGRKTCAEDCEIKFRMIYTNENVHQGSVEVQPVEPVTSAPASRSRRDPVPHHRGLGKLHGVHEVEETYFNRSLEV
ncbi:hypothetical protein BLOT_016584 [Blomia tropicalis]|nr:hypothetical protein BLOT_016584 [Blomia tropicalis]